MRDWTKGTATPPVVKGLLWFTDESKTKEGTGAWVCGQSVGRRLRFCIGRYATEFQAEIYAILACVCEVQFQSRPEKYVSICSDSQAALKALQAIRTSPLVLQYQKALNYISNRHSVGLYSVPGHTGLRGNEIADELARDGSVLKFVGPEPAFGVSRQDICRRFRRWLVKQHCACWWGLGYTQRRARELISGPCLGAKDRFLSFNPLETDFF